MLPVLLLRHDRASLSGYNPGTTAELPSEPDVPPAVGRVVTDCIAADRRERDRRMSAEIAVVDRSPP